MVRQVHSGSYFYLFTRSIGSNFSAVHAVFLHKILHGFVAHLALPVQLADGGEGDVAGAHFEIVAQAGPAFGEAEAVGAERR
jgi:hypothetical protein